MDWQPIETAPKDGTKVWLFRFKNRAVKHAIVQGRWVEEPPERRGWTVPGFVVYWPVRDQYARQDRFLYWQPINPDARFEPPLPPVQGGE